MTVQRLQKVLARAGVASRRAAEALITAGRVTVDGRLVTEIGTKVDSDYQRIEVDGKPIKLLSQTIVYLLNKPRGVVSSRRDEKGRQTVTDLVSKDPPVYPVGRLDRMSEGLVLLTNDGDLAYRLTHPKFGHEKEYELTGVTKRSVDELLALFQAGVVLSDGEFRPDRVTLAGLRNGQLILRVVIHEGRSHLLRRAAAKLGFEITRLRRVRMGPIQLGKLPVGQYRKLSESEMAMLRAWIATD